MGNCTGQTQTDALNEYSTKLMLKTSTWVRDSHELFDYESPHLMKKTFKIQNTCGLIREETEIEAIGEKEMFNGSFTQETPPENPSKQPPIVHLSYYKGYYSIFHAKHKIDPKSRHPILLRPLPPQPLNSLQKPAPSVKAIEEDEDANKLWLITRYMTIDGKTNEFKLTGGETIKLGRVKFIVREIQTADDENKTDYDSFENNFFGDESGLQVRGPDQIMPNQMIEHFSSYEQNHEPDDQLRNLDLDEEEKKENPHVVRRRNRSRADIHIGNGENLLLSSGTINPADSNMIHHTNHDHRRTIRGSGDQNEMDDDDDDLEFSSQKLLDPVKLDQSCTSEKDMQELSRTIEGGNQQSEQNLCRICFSENFGDENPLISPCKCSGSLKVIHLECLRTWLSRKENVKTTQNVISYSWKAFHCELCKSEYNDKIYLNDRTYWLFEISKPKSNYVILESVQLQNTSNTQNNHYNNQSKTLHVLNLNNKNIIKIGRGHDNDLRIADISVSRCHSFFKKDSKGNIIIEDNQSKFGTLVQIKAPMILSENLIYYIQAGRTIIKAQVQPEWSILGNFMKSNVSKKSEAELHEKNNPNSEQSGDYFYDHIGKYCNGDAAKNNKHQIIMMPHEDLHNEENINDQSGEGEGVIPDEENQIIASSSQKIQDIKTNQFRIKLTSLREAYHNERIISSNQLPAEDNGQRLKQSLSEQQLQQNITMANEKQNALEKINFRSEQRSIDFQRNNAEDLLSNAIINQQMRSQEHSHLYLTPQRQEQQPLMIRANQSYDNNNAFQDNHIITPSSIVRGSDRNNNKVIMSLNQSIKKALNSQNIYGASNQSAQKQQQQQLKPTNKAKISNYSINKASNKSKNLITSKQLNTSNNQEATSPNNQKKEITQLRINTSEGVNNIDAQHHQVTNNRPSVQSVKNNSSSSPIARKRQNFAAITGSLNKHQ